MDIPPFKDLNSRQPVEIHKNGRVFEFFLLHQTRGGEGRRRQLTLEGYCRQKVEGIGRCYVYFKGYELGGNFSQFVEKDQLYLARFDIIIPVPEFWSEAAAAESSSGERPGKFSPAYLINTAKQNLARAKAKLASFRHRSSLS